MVRRLAPALLLVASCWGDPYDRGPKLVPSELSVNFGNVFENDVVTQELVVELDGRVDVVLTAEADRVGSFSIAPATVAMRAGSRTTFTLTFDPGQSPGDHLETLVLVGTGHPDTELRLRVHARGKVLHSHCGPEGTCLDFGTVIVGDEKTLSFDVPSCSNRRSSIGLRILDTAFRVDPAEITLEPRTRGAVDVTFRPPTRGTFEADLLLDFCEGCSPVKWCVRGLGAQEDLFLDPNPLDLGDVAAGSEDCREVAVHNSGDLAFHVASVRLDDALARDPAAFRLELGDLHEERIEPNGSASFSLCFAPDEAGVEHQGTLTVATDGIEEELRVSARAVAP